MRQQHKPKAGEPRQCEHCSKTLERRRNDAGRLEAQRMPRLVSPSPTVSGPAWDDCAPMATPSSRRPQSHGSKR